MFVQRLFLVGFLCSLPMLSTALQTSPEAEKVLTLEKKWTDAYRQHNISILTSMLSEDFVITVEDGRVFGKMGYMAHTADSSVQVDLAEQSDLRVHMHG